MTGGSWQDILTGGAGADLFIYLAIYASGATAALCDTISDFQSGTDKIDLGALDAYTLVAGNGAFTFIGGAAFTDIAGQLRYAAATGQLLGDFNGDSVADFRLDLLNLTTLTAADLIL